MSGSSGSLFTSVRYTSNKTQWGSLAISYIAQAAAVAALMMYTVAVPSIAARKATHVDLVAPPVQSAVRPAPTKPISIASQKPAPAEIEIPRPRIEVPVTPLQQPQRLHRAPEVAEVTQPQLMAAPKLDPKILNSAPAPKTVARIVATNTFNSAAAPALQKASPKVQTGGFGDPNGVTTSAQRGSQPKIAATGAFDMPRANVVTSPHTTVASAGFGNAVAQTTTNRAQLRVQSTSFGSASSPTPDSHQRATNHQLVTSPVTIQSKPIPVYTVEARHLRVEGEVLLNVVFTANGQIRVLNVIRGLGHGLDESAQRAAQGVKFSPAMRDGHPVDSTATLHIVFQLS